MFKEFISSASVSQLVGSILTLQSCMLRPCHHISTTKVAYMDFPVPLCDVTRTVHYLCHINPTLPFADSFHWSWFSLMLFSPSTCTVCEPSHGLWQPLGSLLVKMKALVMKRVTQKVLQDRDGARLYVSMVQCVLYELSALLGLVWVLWCIQ